MLALAEMLASKSPDARALLESIGRRRRIGGEQAGLFSSQCADTVAQFLGACARRRIVEYQQRGAGRHDIAFGNQDFFDDAAFKMLDGSALSLEPDDTIGDHRAGQRCLGRPKDTAAQKDGDHGNSECARCAYFSA